MPVTRLDGNRLLIPAQCDITAAVEARQALLDLCASAAAPLTIEFAFDADDGTLASAPSLQLAAAARRTLENRGTFHAFGPAAQAAFRTESAT